MPYGYQEDYDYQALVARQALREKVRRDKEKAEQEIFQKLQEQYKPKAKDPSLSSVLKKLKPRVEANTDLDKFLPVSIAMGMALVLAKIPHRNTTRLHDANSRAVMRIMPTLFKRIRTLNSTTRQEIKKMLKIGPRNYYAENLGSLAKLLE